MATTLFAGVMAVLFATSILLDVAAAASYTVGGSSGWTIPPNATFYSDWSKAQKLAPGDTLVFNFPTGIHNVVKVPKASYDACSAQNQIGSTLSNGPATVTLASGTHYYICGVAGHCSAGQKLAITVAAAAAAAPSPSPAAATTPASPTPAAATTPSSPSPASAPAATTPAQAPASIAPTAISPDTAPTSKATPPTVGSPAPAAATSPPPAAGGPAPSAPSDVPVPGSTGTASPPAAAAAGPSGPGTSSSPAIRSAAGAVFLLSVATASLLL